jgi:hypothetical protein
VVRYRVVYGDPIAMLRHDRHVDELVCTERFSTEYEALNRAREVLDQDFSNVVVIRDDAGNELSGVRLQLRLGYLHHRMTKRLESGGVCKPDTKYVES